MSLVVCDVGQRDRCGGFGMWLRFRGNQLLVTCRGGASRADWMQVEVQ